ncbi:MAG TPA: urate oxidase [Thermoanaerobaculia bacterium]|nr:urate oxidase [Thermoanaerobaculia bacterium]
MLADNSYGKSGIRLVKILRRKGRHDFRDLTVAVRLEGDFEAAHVAGDNSAVLPTDTMKNTVYALAKDHFDRDIESFSLFLTEHFVTRNPNVSRARVEISERPWERLTVDGRPHPHAFSRPGGERRIARVLRTRQGAIVEAGLEDLTLAKSTQSGFSGFRKDGFTTLKETEDRILATAVKASWTYAGAPADFDRAFQGIRGTMLETFAAHDSASVQHTLYAMGEAVLEHHAEVVEVRLSLPNKHHIPVDLSPFGLENRNEIFVATEEPFGVIEATIRR